nr:MAG TPA: hypothetical protein [Caudoviricetes sp.]
MRQKKTRIDIVRQILEDKLVFTDWFHRSVGTYNARNTSYNRSHYDRF